MLLLQAAVLGEAGTVPSSLHCSHCRASQLLLGCWHAFSFKTCGLSDELVMSWHGQLSQKGAR